MGKASTRAHNKYNAKAYDRINLTVAKGQKENIQAHATAHGESVNGFIGRAIVETMERDGVGGPQRAAELTAVAGAVSIPPAALEAVQAATQPTGAAQKAVASLSPEMLEVAQAAAEAAGESLTDFMRRAVETQAQRDKAMRGLKR